MPWLTTHQDVIFPGVINSFCWVWCHRLIVVCVLVFIFIWLVWRLRIICSIRHLRVSWSSPWLFSFSRGIGIGLYSMSSCRFEGLLFVICIYGSLIGSLQCPFCSCSTSFSSPMLIFINSQPLFMPIETP